MGIISIPSSGGQGDLCLLGKLKVRHWILLNEGLEPLRLGLLALVKIRRVKLFKITRNLALARAKQPGISCLISLASHCKQAKAMFRSQPFWAGERQLTQTQLKASRSIRMPPQAIKTDQSSGSGSSPSAESGVVLTSGPSRELRTESTRALGQITLWHP